MNHSEKPVAKQSAKPKYNMWQNSAWMAGNARRVCKSVLFLVILSAIVSAGKTITELLIAPVILSQVENEAPLSALLGTIAAFTVLLFFLSGSKGYLENNTIFGRSYVRLDLMYMLMKKSASTSFSNLLDTAFNQAMEKANRTICNNISAGEVIWETWSSLLASLIGFFVYLALLSGLHPLLLLLTAATTVIGYLISKKAQNWNYEHKDEEADSLHQMNYALTMSIKREPAKDIRIFGLQSWLEDVWNSAYRFYRSFVIHRERHQSLVCFSDMLLSFLRNGAAYAYLIWLTLSKGLSASEFLLYFNAFSGFSEWIRIILDSMGKLNQQSLELSLFREFLEWPEPFLFEGGRTPEPVFAMKQGQGKNYPCELTLEHVSYRYPNAAEDSLKDINLTIHPGEKLAVVGANGAGKTTLVRLLGGFLDPTSGRVLLNGEDIRQFNRRDYYQLFSTVFQDFSVIDATVKENVAQRAEGIDEKKAESCLDKAGLTEKIHSLPKGMNTQIGRSIYEDGAELSGGETQRLMLARALYKEAPILILDEPTAALDPISENEIYQNYSEMTEGCTSLFISHRLASTRFCDRILFLEHGQIAEEGTHESLLAANGSYAHLFDVQSQYYQETPDSTRTGEAENLREKHNRQERSEK